MKHPPAQLDALLEVERKSVSRAPAETMEQVWNQVVSAAGGPGPERSIPGARTASRWLTAGKIAGGTIGAVAAVSACWYWASSFRAPVVPAPASLVLESKPPSPPLLTATEGPASIPPSSPRAPVSPPPMVQHHPQRLRPMTPAEPHPRAEDVSAPVAEAPAAQPPATPVNDQTALEFELLETARAELMAGNARDAWMALEVHQDRFVGSVLEEERSSLQVQCLLEMNEYERAARAAEKFLGQFPNSIHQHRIEGALRAAQKKTEQ